MQSKWVVMEKVYLPYAAHVPSCDYFENRLSKEALYQISISHPSYTASKSSDFQIPKLFTNLCKL